jgi:hypothetical protein
MPHGHGRHAESPDAQGLAVSKATRDIGQESNWLLDARIGVSGLTSDRPCVRKGNHPPGPAALAEAARLLGPAGREVTVDLGRYAELAGGDR